MSFFSGENAVNLSSVIPQYHTYISSRHDSRRVGRKNRAPLLPTLAYLFRFFNTHQSFHTYMPMASTFFNHTIWLVCFGLRKLTWVVCGSFFHTFFRIVYIFRKSFVLHTFHVSKASEHTFRHLDDDTFFSNLLVYESLHCVFSRPSIHLVFMLFTIIYN